MSTINEAAAILGRKGGQSKSPAKVAASKANIEKTRKSLQAWYSRGASKKKVIKPA